MRGSSRKKFCSAFFLLALSNTSAQLNGSDPNNYLPHPETSLRLGSGFSSSNLGDYLPDCFSFKKEAENLSGVQNANVNLYLATSAVSLSTAQNIEARISARVLKFKFNGGYSNSFSEKLDENSIYLVMQATIDYGRNLAREISLKPNYAHLLKTPKLLIDTCGDKIVASERVGRQLSVIIEIKNASRKTQEVVSAFASGSGKIGPAKVSISARLNREVSQAYENSQISYTVSGDLAPKVAAALTSVEVWSDKANSLNSIAKILSATLQEASNPFTSNAPSTQNPGAGTPVLYAPATLYSTGTVAKTFGLPEKTVWSDWQERLLAKIAEQYFLIAQDLSELDSLNKRTSKLSNLFSPEEIGAYNKKYSDSLQASAQSLIKAHKDCIELGGTDPNKCSFPKNIVSVNFARFYPKPIDLRTKMVMFENNIYDNLTLGSALRVMNTRPNNRPNQINTIFKGKYPLNRIAGGYASYIYVQNQADITGYNFFLKRNDKTEINLSQRLSSDTRIIMFGNRSPFNDLTPEESSLYGRIFPSTQYKLVGLESEFVSKYCNDVAVEPSLYVRYTNWLGEPYVAEIATLISSGSDRCSDVDIQYSLN